MDHPKKPIRQWVLISAVAVCLMACGAPRQSLELPAVEGKPPQAPGLNAGAETYQIDAEASTLHILVFRGGSMARLGHNHVVSSRHLQGTVWRGPNWAQSGFDLRVPVNDLIMDDNDARTQEGPDFPLNVSDEAKAGTKVNMLRPTLLDGEHYPEIRIRSLLVSGTQDALRVRASIRIKEQTREVDLPVVFWQRDGVIEVQGDFELRQTDFGITPLSVAMGALQVVDAVKIKFRLVARTTFDVR